MDTPGTGITCPSRTTRPGTGPDAGGPVLTGMADQDRTGPGRRCNLEARPAGAGNASPPPQCLRPEPQMSAPY